MEASGEKKSWMKDNCHKRIDILILSQNIIPLSFDTSSPPYLEIYHISYLWFIL